MDILQQGHCDGFETRGRPGAPAALPFKVTLGEATVAEYPAMSMKFVLIQMLQFNENRERSEKRETETAISSDDCLRQVEQSIKERAIQCDTM